MIKLISNEQMKFTENKEEFDFDNYNIEVKSQLSTKEFSIIVDFVKNEITGDVVAYGDWHDIETDECIELLEIILKDNKPIRDFSHIINKLNTL